MTTHDLVLTRAFAAPRERVLRFWNDPALARRWMGPRGFTATHVEGDARPGGAWRLGLRDDRTGAELWQGGVYREVAPGRVVYTFAWDEEGGRRGPETLVTLSFAEADGRTTMTFRQEGFASAEERDGHREGWASTFDRLAEALGAA